MDHHPYPSADVIAHHANGPEAKVAVVDHEGTILSVNQAWRASAISRGYDAPGHGVGVNYLKLCDQADGHDADYAQQAAAALRCVLAGKRSIVTFEYVCASIDHEKWAMFIANRAPPEWPSGAIVAHVDISPVRDVEQALRRSEKRLRQHLDSLPILVAYLDRMHRYRLNNQAYETWFGMPSGELRNKAVSDIIGAAAYREIRPHMETCLSGQSVEFEKSLGLKDGRRVHVRCNYVPDFDDSGQIRGMFAFVQDITKERSLAVRIEHQSMHDALTGLPNRSLFQSHLKEIVEAGVSTEPVPSLMIIDLDDFKDINDTLGHPLGDKLLCAVARRLSEAVAPNDILARLGGDEFAIIRTAPATEGRAQALAKQIVEKIEAPFHIDGHELHISTCIGIAPFRENVAEISQLMKQADLALYHAKSLGRGRHQVFVDQMWTDLMRRQRMLQGLRQALHTEQLTLHYQPQIDLQNGAIVSVESLARWRHPKCGDIEPRMFVPIAEASGLIGALGQWVLRQASTQATAWRAAGHRFRVAVNVSPAQIKHGDFLNQIQQAMAATNVEPDWLEFEITEALLIDTDRRDRRILEQIADLGINLAIDDFGSGYSSLAYLKKLPVDKVKIDQGFVRDIGVDSDNEAIVKAIITLGHQLGKRVTAEGVESAAQAAFLAENGCDEAQGFYFARPQTEDGLDLWLEQRLQLQC